MNTRHCSIVCLALLLAAPSVHSQESPSIPPAGPVPLSEPRLTIFNLDFAGGTPKQLVAAIEKAMGRPLNAIVPAEYASEQLPPLKMNGVTAPQLFDALRAASNRMKLIQRRFAQYEYGFKTNDRPTDDSIWYFYVRSPAEQDYRQPPVCQFYAMTPYLAQGLTVDDITTAIRTGWKMLGEPTTEQASISYHQETKLLIAVGEPQQLEVIERVLRALSVPKSEPAQDVKPDAPAAKQR